MRIALISTAQTQTPPVGYGAEAATWDLAVELAALSHEVVLFAPEGSKTPPGGQLCRLPGPLDGSSPRVLNALRGAEAMPVWQFQGILAGCDIVHDLSLTFRTHELLRIRGQKKSLCTLNGISWTSPEHPEGRRNIVVVSEAAKRYASKGWYAWKDTPYEDPTLVQPSIPSCEVVRYGCNLQFYAPAARRLDYVLYAGRPHEAKGIELLLLAAKGRPDLKFKLAWHAALEDHKQREANVLAAIKSERLSNVEFIDLGDRPSHHEQKADLMAHCAVFLHPAIYIEACARGIIEAQACGAPVVAFDRGGNTELVRDGETGVIVPYFRWWEDRERIARDLGAAIDRARSEIDPQAARAHAVNCLSARRMALDYLRLYERAARGETW